MTYLKKIIFILVIAGFFITPLSFIYAQQNNSNNNSDTFDPTGGLLLDNPTPSTDGSTGGENNVSNISVTESIKNSSLVRMISTIFTFGVNWYERGGGISGTYASVATICLSLVNGLFNQVVYISVVKFSSIYQASGNSINNAWKIGRDLANFFFIFILLYIAISTIINRSNDWQKLLSRIIIIALLINFSAVIPKVMIDASNVLALAFYDNIGNKSSDGQHDLTAAFLNKVTPAPSGSWFDQVLNKATFNIFNLNNWLDGTMIFILTYILLVASILFIIRIAVLLMLIILSPFAFIGWIIPSASGYSKQWWERLVGESIFAPAFMFILFITITLVSGYTTDGKKSTSIFDAITNIVTGNSLDKTSQLDQLINFFIIVVFLTAALTVAKKFSSTGAGIAIGWGNKIKKLALGGAALGAGVAGAYTLGKGARTALKSDAFQNFAARNPFVGNLANAGLSGIAKKKFGGAASYEDRVEKTASRIDDFKTSERRYAYLNSLGEIDRKAAYGKLNDRQKAELHEYNKEQLDKAIIPGATTAQIDQARKIHGIIEGLGPKPGSEPYEKMEAERQKIRDNQNVKQALNTIKPPLSPAGTPTPPPPKPEEIKTALKTLKGKNINKLDPDVLSDPDIAQYLTSSHLSVIKEHPGIDQSHKDKIRRAIEDAVTKPGAKPDQSQIIAANWLNGPGGVDF